LNGAVWLDTFLDTCCCIERSVRDELDPAAPVPDEAALSALVRAEVLRSAPRSFTTSLAEQATRFVVLSMRSLGPLTPLLAESRVGEIAINAPRRLWVRRMGSFQPASLGFYDDDHVRRVLERLVARARGSQRHLDPGLGVQDLTLHDGSRLHVVPPELSASGSWAVNLRRPFRVLEDAFSDPPSLLVDAMRAGAPILVAGLPGAGKTTLARSPLVTLAEATRIIVVEEVGETRVSHANVAHLQTRRGRVGSEEISLRSLVAASLRMTPERLVVGEIRDAEALPFVLAIASGVPGLSTIHARDPRGALERLVTLAQLAPEAPPTHAVRQLVAEAVDLVAYVHWDARPRLSALVGLEGVADPRGSGPFVLTDLLSCSPAQSSRLLRCFPTLARASAELLP